MFACLYAAILICQFIYFLSNKFCDKISEITVTWNDVLWQL